jgi:Flp pilus assembly secretin CpaC
VRDEGKVPLTTRFTWGMSERGELRVRFIPILGLLIGALVSASASADETSLPSADVLKSGVLRLATGTSEVLRINNARTIIIGKPEIADANALAEGVIAVTAKSAGSTNMIVLDEKHDIILRTDVQVADVQVGPRPRTIQVFQGEKVQSYSCGPNCISAPTASVNNNEVATASDASGSFRNCDAARAAGASSIRRGQPGYAPHLDADDDGIACEPAPLR